MFDVASNCAKFPSFINEYISHKTRATAPNSGLHHKFRLCMFCQRLAFIISFNIPFNNLLSFRCSLRNSSTIQIHFNSRSRCSAFRINLNFFFSIRYSNARSQQKNGQTNECRLGRPGEALQHKSNNKNFSHSSSLPASEARRKLSKNAFDQNLYPKKNKMQRNNRRSSLGSNKIKNKMLNGWNCYCLYPARERGST